MNNYQLPPAQYGYGQQNCNVANRVPKSEVNAVKIELINPQAYGSAPGAPAQPAPMQQAPMMPPQAPVYSYPQNSMYSPMPEMGPMMPPPYIPPTPINQQIVNMPKMEAPNSPNNNVAFVPNEPTPTTPPAAVVDQPEMPEPPAAAPVAEPVVTPAPAEPTAQVAPEMPPADEKPKSELDINPIINNLKSENLEDQFGAIQKIAEVGQQNSPDSDALINEQIFQNLSDIVKRDTSQMQGPTNEQIQLREKKFSGAQLSPQEDSIAETLSPQELAEMNKQYATYTLAVMQKDFRETVDVEAKKQGLEPVKLNEIPEINTVIDNVKANPNPLIREASLSALSYVAKPEDKEPLTQVFNLAQQDADPMVQEAATKALNKLNA